MLDLHITNICIKIKIVSVDFRSERFDECPIDFTGTDFNLIPLGVGTHMSYVVVRGLFGRRTGRTIFGQLPLSRLIYVRPSWPNREPGG